MLNPIEKFKRSILHLNISLHHWDVPCLNNGIMPFLVCKPVDISIWVKCLDIMKCQPLIHFPFHTFYKIIPSKFLNLKMLFPATAYNCNIPTIANADASSSTFGTTPGSTFTLVCLIGYLPNPATGPMACDSSGNMYSPPTCDGIYYILSLYFRYFWTVHFLM